MSAPPGDHAGPFEAIGRRREYGASRRLPLPSARITQTCETGREALVRLVLSNAIRRLSGDQSGAQSTPTPTFPSP
jgi:hypothetical protein